ncbi:MAG: zf-HC2 domain-containing protein [Hyphomicrobiaceae bacterium]
MGEISDKTLMAYADGELSPAECDEVEAALATDPELKIRLSIFERTRHQLSGLYDAPLRRPVPDHLIDVVLGSRTGTEVDAPSPPPTPTGLSKWTSALTAFLPRGRMVYAIPAVAGLLVFAGGLSGWHLRSIGMLPSASDHRQLAALKHGKIVAQAGLRQALETMPSGRPLTRTLSAGGQTVVFPKLTFRTVDKKVCRQYLLTNELDRTYVGVACRGIDNNWQVQIHLAAKGQFARRDKLTPAAGPTSSLIDAHVDQVIDGDALGRNEELGLLESWKSKR